MLYKSFYCVAKIPFPFYCKPACVIYKVPDRITCQLTSALLEEHEEAVGEKPLRMKSSWLLSDMRKLRNSTKESDPRLLENHKLQADVKLSYVDVKLKALHPVLRLEDHLDMLSRENRLDILCGGQDLFAATQLFWGRFEGENPELVSKLRAEKGDLSTCVPFAVYGDEGQSHKKAAFLVFASQPVIGHGTSFTNQAANRPKDLGVNVLGVSCLTRFVYSVMRASCYSKSPEVFHALLDHFSQHCDDLYKDGISVWHEGYQKTIVVYPVIICAKGDWPFLKKCGNLVRTHHQASAHPRNMKGICHLCLAGTATYSDWSKCRGGSWLCSDSLNTSEAPWKCESALTAKLCRNSDMWQKTWFYRPDLFHTLHKGVMAELAGSAIDPRPSLTILLFSCSLSRFFVQRCCTDHLDPKCVRLLCWTTTSTDTKVTSQKGCTSCSKK